MPHKDAASRPKTSKLSTGAIVGCAPSPTLLDQRPFCLPLTSPWWVHLPPRRSNSGWDSELGSLRQMGERMHEHTSMHSLASFFLRVGDRGPRLEQV